jgi:hypothetical protein
MLRSTNPLTAVISDRWISQPPFVDSPVQVSEDRNQPGAWRLRTHSSGSPALRRPSDIHGKSGSSSRISLTVSFGFTRRASDRAAFASASFPCQLCVGLEDTITSVNRLVRFFDRRIEMSEAQFSK